MKQQFIKGTADSFQTYIYENNRKITPASALLTIYKPGGNSTLAVNAAMTIGGDGLLSYSLTAADNAEAALNYKASVTYVHNSKTHYATLFYDVVNSRLTKVITDEDLASELPQIKDSGWRVRGSAEGGTQTSIIDTELKRYENDYFTGGLAYSALKDETREVLGFSSSTGTVTTAAFSAAITPGEAYALTRSFSKEIQRAFEKIEGMIEGLGKRPHLVLDPYDLREAHICFSVAEVCKGLVTAEDGLWWHMWKEYERKAEDAFKRINFKYDYSNDGFASTGEQLNTNIIRAGRR